MAVRVPDRGGPAAPSTTPSTSTQSPVSNQRMVEIIITRGYARAPGEARQFARALTSSLSKAGVRVPERGSDEAKLEAALRIYQGGLGLPVNGVLDEPTERRLRDDGLLGPAVGDVDARGPGKADKTEAQRARDTVLFDKAPAPKRELPTGAPLPDVATKKASTADIEGAAARVDWSTPKSDEDLQALTSRLSSAGFTSRRRGAARLKDSIAKFQQKSNLKRTGTLDPETAKALAEKGLLPESKVPPSKKPPAPTRRSVDAESGEGEVEEEVSSPGSKDWSRADNWGPRPGSALARGKKTPRAVDDEREAALRALQRDRAPERTQLENVGNPAPNERLRDPDENLGAVDIDPNLQGGEGPTRIADDDFGDAPEGTFDVPSLWFQIQAGLLRVARDDTGRGAATYAWDFTLFAPGRYGDDDAPTALLHLVVRKGAAFDQVWDDARFALNTRLLELEPASPRVSEQDVLQALRRARVRDT